MYAAVWGIATVLGAKLGRSYIVVVRLGVGPSAASSHFFLH